MDDLLEVSRRYPGIAPWILVSRSRSTARSGNTDVVLAGDVSMDPFDELLDASSGRVGIKDDDRRCRTLPGRTAVGWGYELLTPRLGV